MRRVRSWLWNKDGKTPDYSDGVYDHKYVYNLLCGLNRYLCPPWHLELWVDEFWYERRLFFEAAHHCLSLVRFTDEEKGGWTRMMQIYGPEHRPEEGERILAVGMDTIITGDIDWLFEWDEAPCGFPYDPYVTDTICNGVSTFDRKGADILWKAYLSQDFDNDDMWMGNKPSEMMLMRKVWKEHGWPVLDDSTLFSFKAHYQQKREGTPCIVYFHGIPKPHDIGGPLRFMWDGMNADER
jgi:hypothetical protein